MRLNSNFESRALVAIQLFSRVIAGPEVHNGRPNLFYNVDIVLQWISSEHIGKYCQFLFFIKIFHRIKDDTSFPINHQSIYVLVLIVRKFAVPKNKTHCSSFVL